MSYDSFIEKYRKQISAISVLMIVIGVMFILGGIQTRTQIKEPDIPEESAAPVVLGYGLPRSTPVRIRIPSIGVDTYFVGLGLAANKEIQVPRGFEEVGWYINGPTPGEIGPSVILGHVDSYMGPAVFFGLGQLEIGDRVEVDREDGKTAIFQVDKIERYPQSEFPTSLVYGDIDYAGIRLITCSGSFDAQLQRYDSNLIVYGSLIGEE